MSEISDVDRKQAEEIWRKSMTIQEFIKAIAAALAKARQEGRRAPDPVMAGLITALEEISKGDGPFNHDPLIHAGNCIENMKMIARVALEAVRKGTT
jgi:hypothetical protein